MSNFEIKIRRQECGEDLTAYVLGVTNEGRKNSFLVELGEVVCGAAGDNFQSGNVSQSSTQVKLRLGMVEPVHIRKGFREHMLQLQQDEGLHVALQSVSAAAIQNISDYWKDLVLRDKQMALVGMDR